MSPTANVWTIAVTIIGSIAVITSYFIVFSLEKTGYTTSRFWVGISESNATSLIPMQILAGVGFLLFVCNVVGLLGNRPSKGILSYWNGYACTIIFAAFFMASVLWPYAARRYLDARDAHTASAIDVFYVMSSLVVAACSAILMVAGAFEENMHPLAMVGILLFAMVVVLADAVGWNAKLMYGYLYDEPRPSVL